MAGYNNFSKSNNAIDAESNGRFPASVVAKKLKVPTSVITDNHSPCEWHHSSKAYNKVDYYDLEDISTWLGTTKGKAAVEAAKAALKSGATIYHNCHVEWLEWSGSLRNAKCTEKKANGATVSVKGVTATVTLATGETFQKRLSTNGFSFKAV